MAAHIILRLAVTFKRTQNILVSGRGFSIFFWWGPIKSKIWFPT